MAESDACLSHPLTTFPGKREGAVTPLTRRMASGSSPWNRERDPEAGIPSGRRLKPNSSHVDGAGEFLGQYLHQAMREIVVEEELHGRGSEKSFLSRGPPGKGVGRRLQELWGKKRGTAFTGDRRVAWVWFGREGDRPSTRSCERRWPWLHCGPGP